MTLVIHLAFSGATRLTFGVLGDPFQGDQELPTTILAPTKDPLLIPG